MRRSRTDSSPRSDRTRHIPGYDVGVDYHAYGADFASTGFLNQYQDPAVRQIFRAQLQGMADRGATVISTRIWLVNGDERTTGADETWEATFPISDQQKRNLRAYAQDVAAVRGAGGNRLRLDLCLLWLWDADYTTGSPATGLGQSGLSATEFTSRVAVTTDKLLAAVAGVKRPDGKLVVDTIYLDGEVMVGAKANQEVVPHDALPALRQGGIEGRLPAVALLQRLRHRGALPHGWLRGLGLPDPGRPPLDVLGVPQPEFMADQGLPLPQRVDFSWYVPAEPGAPSSTLLARALDDADATLPSLGLPKSYGIAETRYYPDATERRELGQAIAAEAAQNPRLQRVCFWTTPDSGGLGVHAGYPFAIEDFYPPAN